VSTSALADRRLLDDELERFALGLAASRRRWESLLPGASTDRSYALIASDERVNAWAIRWGDDADTGFHDHDGSAAGIAVIEGCVVEERLALVGSPISRTFRAGQSFHLPGAAIHRVRHGGGRLALTVHAYSPPLVSQGVYRNDEHGALERTLALYTEELRADLATA
jgi:hypothetical protein